MLKKNSKGFSLIELIVVIAIIGILVMLAAPKFIGYTEKAKVAGIQNDIKVVEGKVEEYLINEQEFASGDVIDLKTKDNLYSLNGKIEDVDTIEAGEYRVVALSILKEVKSKLKGTFYANNNGKVYYEHDTSLGGAKKVDKTALQDKIAEAEAIDKGNHTDESWDDLQNSIIIAKEVEADKKAKQDEVDQAVVDLEDAIKNLVDTSGWIAYVTINYVNEEGNIIETETKELPRGTHIVVAKEIEGYVLAELDTKEVTVVSDNEKITIEFKINPTLAKDSDFQWINSSYGYNATNQTKKGYYKYIGTSKVVEIPHSINGNPMTSYYSMFRDSNVEKVISTNKNIVNMGSMFRDSKATSLDLSQLTTSNVADMSSIFFNSQATTLDLSSFDTSNVTNMTNMFRDSKATSLDLSFFDTPKVTSMHMMFSDSQAINLDLSSFTTLNVANMSRMFKSSQATSLDLSSFDTSNVKNMEGMFDSSQATSLDLSSFDTSKVTDMMGMFYNSKAIELDLSSFDTSNVTIMNGYYSYYGSGSSGSGSGMFQNAKATKIILGENFKTDKLTSFDIMFAGTNIKSLDFSKFVTINATSMSGMFDSSGFETLDLSSFNTSNVRDMSGMFCDSKATNLNLSKFNTSNVTNMSHMFYNSQTTSLDLGSFNTSNVTDMSSMFYNSQATSLDVSFFNTSNVTDMSGMFKRSQATSLDLSSFDTSNVTDMDWMFYNSEATTGYARTQADADSFNSSYHKPWDLTFVVKQ